MRREQEHDASVGIALAAHLIVGIVIGFLVGVAMVKGGAL